MQLDGFDRKIVAALAADGRMTTVELASRVGLSPSACTRRLQALEADRVIRGYRAMRRRGSGRPRHHRLRRDHARPAERRDAARLRAGAGRMPERALLPPDVGDRATISSACRRATCPISSDLHANVLGHLPGVARIEFEIRAARSDRPAAGADRVTRDEDLRRRHRRRAVHGASLAYHLAADPAFDGSVLLIEKDPSFRSRRRRFRPARSASSSPTPINIAISLHGIDFLRSVGERLEVDGERPDIGLREGGYLFLATQDGAATLRAIMRCRPSWAPTSSISIRRRSRRAFPRSRPRASPPAAWGRSGEGWFDGYALMQALRRKARALGVETDDRRGRGDRA